MRHSTLPTNKLASVGAHDYSRRLLKFVGCISCNILSGLQFKVVAWECLLESHNARGFGS